MTPLPPRGATDIVLEIRRLGVFLAVTFGVSWETLRQGSVRPTAIGHGAVNAIASLVALLVRGNPNPLLGPLPVGLLALLPFALVASWVLYRSPTLAGNAQPRT